MKKLLGLLSITPLLLTACNESTGENEIYALGYVDENPNGYYLMCYQKEWKDGMTRYWINELNFSWDNNKGYQEIDKAPYLVDIDKKPIDYGDVEFCWVRN